MIRTVIVDDEVLATVGLKAMIDWPAHGFEIVGEGDNGENGLEVIRRTRPELVITDIMMPRVDGLEMMRRVLEEFPGVRFVVLSGYNEFSLVKKALQQGARDYILKLTLRPETLLETLDTLRRDILAGRPGGVGPADGVPRMDGGRETRRELRRAMEGHGEAARVGPILRGLGFEAGVELRLALVRVCPQEKTGTASGEARRFGDVLVDMIGKLAADFYPSYCFPWEDDAFVLLMGIERDADAARRGQEQEQELENVGESLVRLLRQYVNIETAVGFSGPCEGAPGLSDAFSQAEKSVSRSFYDGYGCVYLYPGKEAAATLPPASGPSYADALEQAVASCDAALIQQTFDRLLSRIRAIRPTRAETLENVCHLLTLMDARLGDEWRESPERKGMELHARVFRIRTFAELGGFLDEYRSVVADRMVQIRHSNTQTIILRARRYIAENIERRITLRETADQLHVSAGYLSTLFPRVTHARFSDYVNQAKIHEAQEMIRSGRYRVYEVSDALSFQAPSYFSKTFRRFAGCSPSEFARRVEPKKERDADRKETPKGGNERVIDEKSTTKMKGA